MNLIEQIKKANLTDKESRVYLALLEIGPSFVSEISKKSGVSRTFCYDVLNKLSLIGLVNPTAGKGTKRKYVAEHPQRLLTYLDNQKKKYEKSISGIEHLLPNLISLYKTGHKPVIKFYEGTEGVKLAFLETLEQKEEILSTLDVDEYFNTDLEQWMKDYIVERVKRKIAIRILINPTKKSIDFMPVHPAKKFTEYRWLSKKFNDFGCEINIFGTKTLMAILKKPSIAVIIDSKPLSNVFRAMFEMAWETADKTKK